MSTPRRRAKWEPRALKTSESAWGRDVLRPLTGVVCLACVTCLALSQRAILILLAKGLQVQLHATATSLSLTNLGVMLSRVVARGILALSVARAASASLLYASSYGGNVTTLSLTPSGLDIVSSTPDCSPDPTWLTLDHAKSLLYCLGEGLSTRNGSLAAFKTSPQGALELLHKVDTINGPVSSVLYGNAGLAVAHYSGSSVSSFEVPDLGLLQAKTWSWPLGPNTTRQLAPHPHQATVDPTGAFVLVPDLGSDLVRVLRIGRPGLGLTEIEPLVATPGSGPRHLDFLCTGKRTFLYLVAELDNTVTVYELKYGSRKGKETLAFKKVSVVGIHGDKPVPQSTGAEVHLSPDKRFLLVSSRTDRSFTIRSFNDTTKTIPSDSIISFAVNHETGGLTSLQAFPAGGLVPRQFSINKAGDRLAVGLQADGRVTIIERDVKTGLLKRFVASASLQVGVTSVIFDE